MFDIMERNNGWETLKVGSPKTYFSGADKLPRRELRKLKRGHYLNDLYMQTKHIPGVGKYSMKCFPEAERKSHRSKPPSRKTYLDEIIDMENREGRPGPANYFRLSKPSGSSSK